MPKKKKLEPVESLPSVVESPKYEHREPKDINEEYSAICTLLGDKLIKIMGFEIQISTLKGDMDSLKAKIATLGEEMTKSAEERKVKV